MTHLYTSRTLVLLVPLLLLLQADVVVEFTVSKKTVNAVVGTPLSQLCAKNKIKVSTVPGRVGTW